MCSGSSGKRRYVEVVKSEVDGSAELNEVEAFVAVVQAQGFTRAAERMGIPKSGVSRRVAKLESTLGVRLIHRTTRSFHLTEVGQRYYERASRALAELEEARSEASRSSSAPAGVVRITVPPDAGSGPVVRALVAFTQRYPEMQIEVDSSTRMVDLVAEGFDLAVRAGKLQDSTLVARKLSSIPFILVAHRDYLKRRGTPKTLADLSKHECVLFRARSGRAEWKLQGPDGEESVSVSGRISGSDYAFVMGAVVAGMGIGFVPAAALPCDASRIVHVLPQYAGPMATLHLVYPSSRLLPQRVVLLRDYLLENLKILDETAPAPNSERVVKGGGRPRGAKTA
jgi:DNA-binding transcriptional LysR family regulator